MFLISPWGRSIRWVVGILQGVKNKYLNFRPDERLCRPRAGLKARRFGLEVLGSPFPLSVQKSVKKFEAFMNSKKEFKSEENGYSCISLWIIIDSLVTFHPITRTRRSLWPWSRFRQRSRQRQSRFRISVTWPEGHMIVSSALHRDRLLIFEDSCGRKHQHFVSWQTTRLNGLTYILEM